jgi:hypothetical protein
MAANFLERFLGSEGTAIMITGKDLVFFAILLVTWIFLFRLFYVYGRMNKKYRFLLKLMYVAILLAISMFFYCIRSHFLFYLGLCLSGILCPFVFVINNVSSGEIVPYYSENSDSEDSFGLQVLAEPWPVTHNLAFESSMRNRILAMENNHSIFLLDKERGVYWNEIKTVLDQAPSQEEYNRLLEFENSDLQIREKKDECYSLFIKVLSEHPDLLENAQYTSPTEAIISYLENTREELETEEVLSPADTDKAEMRIYAKIVKDINQNGPQSYYIKKILGYFDKDGGF